jgi:hypothetical protein
MSVCLNDEMTKKLKKIGKIIFIIILIILLFLIALSIRKRYIHIKKNEPLFTKKYLDLSENISNDNTADNFSYSIQPSKNGIEFTLSCWLYIKNAGENLYRGNNAFTTPVIIFTLSYLGSGSPTLVYNPPTGTLSIYIASGDTYKTYELGQIKQQRWTNIIIRLSNRNLDYFKDSYLEESFLLPNVPLIGEKTIKFGASGGGYVYVGIPRYYNRLLSINEIYRNYQTYKNKDPPTENGGWWLPCLVPQCWLGINNIYPINLDINLEASALKP